ncbi:MAG TPA: cytochrome c3 family protein [Thermoanaerobaculia bacterium]
MVTAAGRNAILALLIAAPLALAAAAAGQEVCLNCHGDADLVGDAALAVDGEAWSATVHGTAGIGCLDCHHGKTEYPHDTDAPEQACATCHDAAAALVASAHAPDSPGAARPTCASCHGELHVMVPLADSASPMSDGRQPETCGACHADPRLAAEAGVRLVQPIAAYTASVHARGVARGEHAATCSSCHGTHDILRGAESRSRVHRENVPATCGECHAEITATYEASVHGVAAAQGIQSSPVCTDCHGEHGILGPADKGSPVFASNVPRMTCGRCHGDLRVTSKFGMKADAVVAFEDSFHGLASRSGSVTVANCASCHGVHDILPSSDSRSHIHTDQLAATCGSCHPGAGASFAIGTVHVLPQDRDTAHPAVYWVRIAYLWLIWLTIGSMAAHNLLDLYRKASQPLPRPVVPVGERRVRMVLGFRVAHAALFTSFFALVWSGFALEYPDAWWAQPLLTWEGQLGVRGWLHRGAALVMLATFAFHAVHLVVDRRARACVRAMLPGRHDLRELGEKLAWYLGKRREMPPSPPLGYAEKAEYLALLWGTVVMAASGFVLWFENWSLAHLPKWTSDVATVVHFYEAILASLAILVWHFYFVMLDPLVYPMDTAWLTGREAPGRSLERTAAFVDEIEPPAAAK